MIDIKRFNASNYVSALVIILFLCLGVFMAGAKEITNHQLPKGEKTSMKKNHPRENLTGKPAIPRPNPNSKLVQRDPHQGDLRQTGPISKARAVSQTTASTTSAIPAGAASLTGTYRVRSGDSLYTIARSYGISVSSLKKANGLQSTVIYVGQYLKIPSQNIPSPEPSGENPGSGNSTNPWLIMVSKSQKVLDVYYQNQKWGSYPVELGDGGSGDKQVAGDHKTPEGTFYITEKSVLNPEDEYLGTRWMRLSYPNAEDAARGLKQGLINSTEYNEIISAINQRQTPPQKTALGGGVGIHGGDKPSFNRNWTWGCVGLTNQNIQQFFDNLPVGTPVIIQK